IYLASIANTSFCNDFKYFMRVFKKNINIFSFCDLKTGFSLDLSFPKAFRCSGKAMLYAEANRIILF
ncbi:TPA: hypothetical protein ACGH88_004662, partial [Salmonella enterica subsp. enterica serovar Mgulani]